jgi:hypothetical protein
MAGNQQDTNPSGHPLVLTETGLRGDLDPGAEPHCLEPEAVP